MRQTRPDKVKINPWTPFSLQITKRPVNPNRREKTREQRRDAPTTIPRSDTPQKPLKTTLDICTKFFPNRKGERGFWILSMDNVQLSKHACQAEVPWAKDGQHMPIDKEIWDSKSRPR